ncbi:MAG: aminoglycoside phosphotransferase family protein [Defluviitaleaceae bacterium]|nr:aminoglycoside phosphotransferase family protein [Defluviitaleaceae bacterium]
MEKIILSAENGVYRMGNHIHRPAQPWSTSIKRALAHFEADGLHVEQIINIDESEQVSKYIEGEMVHPSKWTDEGLYAAGQMVAALHKSAESFKIRQGDIWQPWCLRKIGDAGNRIICHGDIAPWNTITKGGLPMNVVDWEYTGPLDRLVELARVCWLFVQLYDDDLAQLHNLPSPKKRAEQVRIVADGYGLPPSDRKRLVSQIIEVIVCETAEEEAIKPKVTFNTTGNLWGLAWRCRSLWWVWQNKDMLSRALI